MLFILKISLQLVHFMTDFVDKDKKGKEKVV